MKFSETILETLPSLLLPEFIQRTERQPNPLALIAPLSAHYLSTSRMPRSLTDPYILSDGTGFVLSCGRLARGDGCRGHPLQELIQLETRRE